MKNKIYLWIIVTEKNNSTFMWLFFGVYFIWKSWGFQMAKIAFLLFCKDVVEFSNHIFEFIAFIYSINIYYQSLC